MKQESLYENIIEWLKDKPLFVQDSARRLLHNSVLSDKDKDDIFILLKKECGFEGIELVSQAVTSSDIPSTIASNQGYPKLLSIKNPVNINALNTNAVLNFDPNGITVVYGKNGSGKSSYSRILKRFCWSRHKDTNILPNIYSSNNNPQSVVVETDTNEHNLKIADQISVSELNSIYVFDSNCSSVYVNNETETQYKPAEIDLIQDLVNLLKDLNQQVNNEEDKLVTTKPELSFEDYRNTNIYSWYSNIEKESSENISSKLTISKENRKRHGDLEELLAKSDPSKENQDLIQKKTRYETLRNELLRIEKAFSKLNFQNIRKLKNDFNIKKGAYELSKSMIEKYNKLAGIGSESWKLLWQAAKKYATTEVHPHVSEYPSGTSANVCMLCQQDLDNEAKKKQIDFDSFIQSNASAEFDQAKKTVLDKYNQIVNVKITASQDTIVEIKQDVDGFEAKYNTFETEFKKVQASWLKYLDENEATNEILISAYQEKEEVSESKVTLEEVKSDQVQVIDSVIYKEELKCISDLIAKEVENIEEKILANKKLLEDRPTLEKEKKELDALLYLESKKTELLGYLTESSLKERYKSCKAKLNTSQYSKKIGDLLETNGINLLKTEFTSVLNFFNTDLASKVCLEKTRTDSGTTFHQLGFSTINGSMNSVLSEGEQKIISLSGFLAECTIGGAKNTIVFDDPVNSLDQDYREAIADKLIELCKDRQIIVFTHDLYFLSLLMYGSKETNGEECKSLSLEFAESSGIVTDEVPFLAKNVQQRIDNIKSELNKLSSLTSGKDTALDSIRKKMRFLVEKSIEEILSNKAIQRFSKNITVKKDLLASYVVTDKNDINYLIDLYGKYSITEHDGGFEIVPKLPDETAIRNDLTEFSTWKDKFKTKLDTYKNNGI
ncbi:MAG TPA: hypothetical protein PK863_05185 [Candidatus Dojkabacteria bacterium]|nr:hypothetical protein [Candidatus Dojkabacteria bacterium]HRP51332.1 hypothetical protein [Candidatus Dojkabacteria bacterium]